MPHLRFRRHYKLLVLLALAAAVLITGFGDQPIIACSLQGTEQKVDQIMIYGHALGATVDAVADNTRILGVVQSSSGANSQ